MKRLLLFVLLLSLGMLALKYSIGDEQAVRATTVDTSKPPVPTSTGVRVDQGGYSAMLSHHGPLDLPHYRKVDLGGGHMQQVMDYRLTAGDSEPVDDTLQRLVDVVLRMFDDGRPVAEVTADEAFVQLDRDQGGAIAFDEHTDIQLRGTLVTGADGSDLEGLRLALGDARVTVGDDDIRLFTEPDQPVELRVAGNHPAKLTGIGAQARLPQRRTSRLRRADVVIQRDPVLEIEGIAVQANGRMRYVEDPLSGAAQISLEDDVRVDVLDGAFDLPGTSRRAAGGTAVKVRGDQFTAALQRRQRTDDDDSVGQARSKQIEGLTWHRITLAGSPATVELPDLRIETPRLTIRAGAFGEPAMITAHGGQPRVIFDGLQTPDGGNAQVVGTAPRHIHLLHPGAIAGAMHSRMGFPRWALQQLERQRVVVLEDEARLESGDRLLTASDGLIAVRHEALGSSDDTPFGVGAMRGRGTIELHQKSFVDGDGHRQPELHARGNDGVLLTIDRDGEAIRLGPRTDESSPRWREHVYSIRHEGAELRGRGSCTITQRQDQTDVELRAPFDEIEADLDSDGTSLRNVRQLIASLRHNQLHELDVTGLPVRAELVRGDERLQAQAPRLRQLGPRSLRLLPMAIDESPWNELQEVDRLPRLARSWRTSAADGDYGIEIRGPRIDVHHTGGQTAMVAAHADGDERPHIYARLPQQGTDEPTTVSCSAERLRLLPFGLPTTSRRAYLGGPLGMLAFHALRRPWLVVDDVYRFELDDDRQGHIEGRARRLFLSEGSGTALFVGDPDDQELAEVTRELNGRTVTMWGARVRLEGNDDVRLSAMGTFADRSLFIPPTMTLHQSGSNGLLAHMQAECRGNIDVTPDAILFGGSVEAFGLRADGAVDPDGVHIVARELHMTRDDQQIRNVTGGDVTFEWPPLVARAADVEIDVRTSLLTVRDPEGADVRLPDGSVFRTPELSVNYHTWKVSTGPGSATRTVAATTKRTDPERSTGAPRAPRQRTR